MSSLARPRSSAAPGSRSTATRRRPPTAQVDLDAPVGAAGDDGRVGVLGEQRERLGEVGGAGEARRDAGSAPAPGRRSASRVGERVVGGRGAQRLRRRRGSAGSRCSGTGCRRARAGRSRWLAARVGLPRPAAVVLRGHAAHEARGAVAALGAAALGHLALHGVQVVGRAEPLGGHDLLPVERRGRHQAGVDRASTGSSGRPSGRATSTEQAPHSPSAHPSLAPVSRSRAASRAAFTRGSRPAHAACR